MAIIFLPKELEDLEEIFRTDVKVKQEDLFNFQAEEIVNIGYAAFNLGTWLTMIKEGHRTFIRRANDKIAEIGGYNIISTSDGRISLGLGGHQRKNYEPSPDSLRQYLLERARLW